MSEAEKKTIKKLVEIYDKLPPEKQQYFNGYAEGVADMVAKSATQGYEHHGYTED